MLLTWVVAAGIIVFAQLATRKIKPVPGGAQNFWEWMVESLYNFLESIIGRELVQKTFWFFATIFIFILFVNWFGLIPGVGTIGWGHHDPTTGVFHIDQPLLRGGNADLNMTSAMALIFFVLWFIWAIQANGVGGFLLHIFGPKGETSGLLKIMMIVIFFMVGWLEIVSILFRPISLSFRLFGNVYAGESILEAMSTMVPALSWLIPIPFYFMEILVGAATIVREKTKQENMILPLLAEMSGSIHVGLAAMGAGIGVGLTGLGAASAVGRNPGAATPILVQAILAIAFTEAIVFYALYLLPH